MPTCSATQSHFFIDEQYQSRINDILQTLDSTSLTIATNQVHYESLFLQLLVLCKQNKYVKQGSGSTENCVKQLLRWLNVNYHTEIDWQVVTQQYALSLRTFHRYLKNKFNVTPQKYLSKIRLAAAYYQLRHSDKTITTIAQDCGFNDSNYFSLVFKKETGQTPSEYREKFKKVAVSAK